MGGHRACAVLVTDFGVHAGGCGEGEEREEDGASHVGGLTVLGFLFGLERLDAEIVSICNS